MKFEDFFDIEKFVYNWDYIESVPEFAILKECEQNPKWHSEGNAWNHTKLVCQAALDYCANYEYDKTYEYDNKILLTAALFHDIGKGTTTIFKKDNWHAYGHELASEKIARRLLWEEDINFREIICSLVRWHMEPLRIAESSKYMQKIFNLKLNVDFELLLKLKRFDVLGSKPLNEVQTEYDLYLLNKMNDILYRIGKTHLGKPGMLNCKFLPKELFNKPEIRVYMMMGISGSGKSTKVEEIIDDEEIGTTVVVSRDIARVALGYCSGSEKYLGTSDEEAMVTAYCNELIRDSAELGKNIIIDDMNLKRKYRDAVKELLKYYNVKYIYVYVEADSIDKNIERRKGQVSPDIIKNMINSIEWPTVDEYHYIFKYRN
jgi:putative nucleotidyltransferase with HDIG domain